MVASRGVPAAPAAAVVGQRGVRGLVGCANPLIVVGAVLGTALAYMSDDMLNLAIPSVARDVDASSAGVQWVLNGSYVPLVAFVLVAGAAGDRIGHRRVLRIGLALFTAGALVSAAAPSVALLTAGRALKGAAAAMVLAAGLTLVTRLHEPSQRDRRLGSFVGMTAAVPALDEDDPGLASETFAGPAFDAAYPRALRAAAVLAAAGLPLVALLQGPPSPLIRKEARR